MRYSGVRAPLNILEFADLINGIQVEEPSLHPLLLSFMRSGDTAQAPEAYRPLLKILSSKSPVCAFIRNREETTYIMNELIKSIKSNTDIRHSHSLGVLADEVPTLFKLISSVGASKAIEPLLNRLLVISENPYPKNKVYMIESPVIVRENEGGAFPALTQIRNRGNYIQDRKNSRAVCHVKDKPKSHQSLLPGIFCLFCQHGK